MTQATADLPEPAAVAQSDAAFHADVLSGFADDDHDSTPTTTPEPDSTASANPDTSPDSAPEDAPLSVQDDAGDALTTALQRIETLEAHHKKYSDDVYGRVGMLEQILKAQTRTPAGQKVQVKLEDFGEFGSEYPDFAHAQLKVINKALSELAVTGLSQEFTTDLIQNAKTAAEQAADARYEQRRIAQCKQELTDLHPDWAEIVGLPDKNVSEGGVPPPTEFRTWLKTQPNHYEEHVLGSDSALVISRALDKFTSWKQAQRTTPRPATSPSQSATSRQQRLAAAVPARTSGSVQAPKRELSWREAMLEEFNAT